jgi:hypothetical protein
VRLEGLLRRLTDALNGLLVVGDSDDQFPSDEAYRWLAGRQLTRIRILTTTCHHQQLAREATNAGNPCRFSSDLVIASIGDLRIELMPGRTIRPLNS